MLGGFSFLFIVCIGFAATTSTMTINGKGFHLMCHEKDQPKTDCAQPLYCAAIRRASLGARSYSVPLAALHRLRGKTGEPRKAAAAVQSSGLN